MFLIRILSCVLFYFYIESHFLSRSIFVFRVYQVLSQLYVRLCWCVDVMFFHHSLEKYWSVTMLMFSFLASFFFFVSFLLWVFGASFFHLFIAHPGYWHCFSAFSMCFSSSCLSCVSIMILFARSYSVWATDNLCVMGCSDVHEKYWSVWVGFLYILILMLLSSSWWIFMSKNVMVQSASSSWILCYRCL